MTSHMTLLRLDLSANHKLCYVKPAFWSKSYILLGADVKISAQLRIIIIASLAFEFEKW